MLYTIKSRRPIGAEGDYTLATILPTALMTMFASPELEPVAREVEAVIKAMMEDAAGAPAAP